jgi:hypothetical protein
MAVAESTDDAPKLPGLKLMRSIGGGTFGEVWLAREPDGTWRAVKLVRRDRFKEGHYYEREWHGHERFEELSRGHVGVVEVLRLERDEDRGFFFCVMELADDAGEGDFDPATYTPRTLRSELTAHGALPPVECLKVGVSLARALAHLHANELVHRDVKPGNVVYVDGKPKLADFGLIAHIDSSLSAVGTFGYIPYEGPGKTTADVFALGKVLYEMATGKDRYDFPELPAPNPELRGLNAVILKACADLPDERYANGMEMADDLERVRNGKRALAEGWGSAAKVLAVMAGLIVLGVVWSQWLTNPPKPSWRDGVVAHWPLDGHARDASGNGYHGEAHGLAPAKDRFGKEGGAVYFDGKAYIDVGDRLDMRTNDFTISVWVKTKSDEFGLVSKAAVSSVKMCWAFHVVYAHNWRRPLLCASLSDVGGRSGLGTNVDPKEAGLTDDRWHQLVAVYDRRGELRMYLDGRLLSKVDISRMRAVDFDSDFHLLLGAMNAEDGLGPYRRQRLVGALDDVRIWRRALSGTEVAAHYADQSPPAGKPMDDWDFEYHFSNVLETNALRHLVATNHVKRFIEWQEPPIAYWGSLSNGVVGEIIYHFPFDKPVRAARLHCSVSTWDFTSSTLGLGRGAGAIDVSTNRTEWVSLFSGLGPQPMWEADGFINQPLAERQMGATNYFVRVRLLKEGAKDPEYATAQHARMSKTKGNTVFEFKARFGLKQ